jgi:hypothetical protein
MPFNCSYTNKNEVKCASVSRWASRKRRRKNSPCRRVDVDTMLAQQDAKKNPGACARILRNHKQAQNCVPICFRPFETVNLASPTILTERHWGRRDGMVKQLQKRADDKFGVAVALATRLPTSIDKRKRHEAAHETMRGAAARKEVRRRSLGDAPSTSRTGRGFNKENDAPERSGSIFDSLSGLLPFACKATLPLVHLFEAVNSTHDPPCVGSKETLVQQHPATATPGQVKSKKPVGIMRLPSTPSCTEFAPSYSDDEESLTSGFSKSARRFCRLFITSNIRI